MNGVHASTPAMRPAHRHAGPDHDRSAVPTLPAHEQGRADLWSLIGALLLHPGRALLQALAAAPAWPADPQADANAALAPAWQALVAAAQAQGADAVLQAHDALFVAVGQPLVDPCASCYLGQGPMDLPLARLRADLRALGLARRPGASVPEDHLGALCETMRLLITGAPGLRPQPPAVQGRFFDAHLQPWAIACLRDIADADRARAGAAAPRFHAALAGLAAVFLATEQAAFALDDGEVESPFPEPADGHVLPA